MVNLSTISAAAALLLGSALCSPLPALTPDSSAPAFYNLNQFGQKYFWDNSGLCWLNYPVNWGECLGATDNATWTAMTFNPTSSNASYTFTQEDATVAECLIDFHNANSARCVTARASGCRSVGSNSKIFASTSVTVLKLGDKTAEVLRDGSEAIVGLEVSANATEGHGGVHFIRINQERRDVEGVTDVEERYYGDISFYFDGDQACGGEPVVWG